MGTLMQLLAAPIKAEGNGEVWVLPRLDTLRLRVCQAFDPALLISVVQGRQDTSSVRNRSRKCSPITKLSMTGSSYSLHVDTAKVLRGLLGKGFYWRGAEASSEEEAGMEDEMEI